MGTVRRWWVRVAAASSTTLLLSCASEPACAASPPESDGECHDIVWHDTGYDEWRTVEKPALTQELGDARYPKCNQGDCGLEGWGSTDIWLVDGVDPEVAFIGYREGTEVAVIFVRVGTDPETVEPSISPGVLD